ncbi:NAD-dependent epimerase/dehydratase family protein [Burkholderia multivorans]|uniref:NAD-dependent epimerase/dehydratase family protein n=1 Tax=Burkholderia multivorans TaxID=87883 RepID=UPI001C216CB0|nr:NAD-dependent epimerase/dehydratase family protein [Burkholderia multivorans]MBU9282744.1 NAD-dependent epimerase/dehydratase family protein [Burkholderia multivorans]MCL4660914.1 NAD-dependent epimerase/dehydratase family protein [Burkholderia multivorans]MCO1352348.1 NAD-dependent epimerase/dehydratase family protein [Burkholderia multivorans]MCO1413808.1 NAD-dependent epimerase/dehydratase family protein [Burkholderia multivorans]MCO1446002.1 NAD-dependent epimerase/dehydratase family pr
MKRVLLVGGGGFIGRHVADACAKAGFGVRVVDVSHPMMASNPANGLAPETEVCVGDYSDAGFLREVIRNIDVVVHLAHDAMRMNIECDMPQEYERNILPATRLMEVCIDEGVKKFVFVSSGGTVYGNQPVGTLITESAVTRPISLYGTSKLCIEHIALLYHVQRQLPAVIVRPGNAYGAGQVPFRGQGLIATALASAQQGREVTIFGDGNAVRDYIHVQDIADAITKIAQDGTPGEIYNVGTGFGVSVRALLDDYLAPALKKNGIGLAVRYCDARRADVEYNVLNCAKLTAQTGWASSIGLQQGVEQTLAWLSTRKEAN